MKIPLSWINEYFEEPLSADQVEKVLTSQGIEVDAVVEEKPTFIGVVVGEVVSCEPHPNADKLKLTTVSDGTENYQVVCGAPNCRQGIRIAFSPIGAKLADDDGKVFKIKKTKIRDVESQGMICSGKELGISEEADGILELSDDLPIGSDFSEQFTEIVFELSLTPNLGHCFGVLGIARELSAGLKRPLVLKKPQVRELLGKGVEKLVSLRVEDQERCPRYSCRVIMNVKVSPSPSWMQERLNHAGIRPVNNIVDITNYVLIETGHPLHAFDLDKIEGREIVVRTASEKEPFTTLDGEERALSSEDLLICDSNQPIAIGGVMGGANSEVSDGTVNVLLESAYFSPIAVRRTSKRLFLTTEASKRFERGCDPNGVLLALERAAELMEAVAEGESASGVLEVKKGDFSLSSVPCRLSRVNKILGTNLVMGEVEEIFNRLNLSPKWDGEDTFTVTVPTYRHDLKEEIDLIEEVVRIYGYDNVALSDTKFQLSTLPHSPVITFEREVRDRMVGEGLQEFLTCDLTSPKESELVPESVIPTKSRLKVMNPISQEQSVLRASLLPGLLGVVKYNIAHQNGDIAGFEVGRIHFKAEEQYQEQAMLGVVLSGRGTPHHWSSSSRECDFYDLKGIVENLLAAFGVTESSFESSEFTSFHPGRQASVIVDGIRLGVVAEVHSQVRRELDLSQRVYFAEINLHDLLKVRKRSGRMEELSIFPGSERDWTVTVNQALEASSILNAIKKQPSKLLESVSLRDLYSGEKVEAGKKNLTFRFAYRDRKKTVEQKRVDKEHERIIRQVASFID